MKNPHQTDIYVGERVRIARNMAGLSQIALANRLDITFQQLQKYEKGVNRISASRLHMIALATHKPVEWFFEGLEQNLPDEAGSSLEQAFHSTDGSRLLHTFAGASETERRLIANLATTIVKGDHRGTPAK